MVYTGWKVRLNETNLSVMTTFQTTTKVADDGSLKIQAPADLRNKEVEVIVIPKRAPAAERVAAWEKLFSELRRSPRVRTITEEDIQREIDAVRSSR